MYPFNQKNLVISKLHSSLSPKSRLHSPQPLTQKSSLSSLMIRPRWSKLRSIILAWNPLPLTTLASVNEDFRRQMPSVSIVSELSWYLGGFLLPKDSLFKLLRCLESMLMQPFLAFPLTDEDLSLPCSPLDPYLRSSLTEYRSLLYILCSILNLILILHYFHCLESDLHY